MFFSTAEKKPFNNSEFYLYLSDKDKALPSLLDLPTN